jgi:flagellar motor switch protein FliM
MNKTLTQAKIDAMLRAASAKQDTRQRNENRSIEPCTFRQSGQLTGSQLSAIKELHEAFAHGISQSLGAYLRLSCEVTLTSTEQLLYKQVLERIPDITYMVCFHVENMNASAALQIEHSLVFPIVDILLGGVGQCQILTREVSEIEEHVMEGVVRIVCQQLEMVWINLGAKLTLDGRQPPAQIQRFMAPTEKTLCLSFEVKLAESSGRLNLILPVSISNTLLRKLSTGSSADEKASVGSSGQMTKKMLDCSFPIDLGIPSIKLPINVVAGLTAQSVCNLGIPVRKPASLLIAGWEAFDATPVRHGRLRAAQLSQSVEFLPEED